MENNLRAMRIAKGMSQQEIADRLGVSAGQVSRWEAGKSAIPSTRLGAIADAYQTGLLMLFGPSAYQEPNATVVPMEGASSERMHEDLPVYGTALGAALVVEGEAIEQTTLNTAEVVQYARRPVILNGRADAYGLYVAGSSMAPVHLEGDLILAETKRPPRIGDDVVVYLRAEGEDDDGRRARAVLVKRLVRRTASYIELEQFQPAKVFRIDADQVLRTDRVMRLADLIS